MPPDLSSIDTTQFFHGSTPVGIGIALIGGFFLALGAQFQHRGVVVVEERHGSGHKAGLSIPQLWRLVRSPWWALGTLLLGYSYRLNSQRSLNVSLGAGLTRDTPDVTLTVRMPVTF